MKKEYTEVIVNNGLLQNGKVINGKYSEYLFTNDLSKNENIDYLAILIIIEIVIFILVLILIRKPKVNKGYVKNPDEVIEPIIAESIIDRKIGGKELIMSCIINLIYKGNIKSIGNDKIELLSINNLTEYEKDIVDMVFEENKIIKFDNIKEKFIRDNYRTKEFYTKFKNIKNKIEKSMYDSNIYSKKEEFGLKIIRVIILVIYVNLFNLIRITVNPFDNSIMSLILYNAIGLIISIYIVFFKKTINLPIKLMNKEKIKLLKVRLLWCVIFCLALLVLETIINTYLFIIIFILLIMNTILFKRSNTHVFTAIGRIEYAKAVGLKRYIEEYSLMKERDVESVIVWDQYLAYAVAFGIPNKIMDRFNEGLMKTNITLQRIDEILKMK